MMSRIWNTRGFRKLRRNRLGIVAGGIIALYLLIAFAVAFGMISKADTTAQVGPRSMPGFGFAQEPEKRYEDADYLLKQVERVIDRPEAESLVKEIRFGEVTVADKSPDELRTIVDRCRAIQASLSVSPDLDEDPSREPELAELEGTVAELYAEPSGWAFFKQKLLMLFGTDRQGRSISARGLYAVKVSMQIGIITALIAVLLGSFLGAAAGYMGGAVDHGVIWLYSTLSAVPNLVLLAVLVFMFAGGSYENTLIPVYAAFSLTFWIGPCRVVRGEVMKLKELDYVHAARALGGNRLRILTRHLLPNVSHLMFINFSLLFIGAIKAEVILTFLGLGVKNEPSWGLMISQSKQEILNDFFWQIGAATALMFGLVLAFNIFTDALQDALDPKHIA